MAAPSAHANLPVDSKSSFLISSACEAFFDFAFEYSKEEATQAEKRNLNSWYAEIRAIWSVVLMSVVESKWFKFALYCFMAFRSIGPCGSSKRVWHVGHNAIRFLNSCFRTVAHGTMCAISTGVDRHVGIAHRWPASMSTRRRSSLGTFGRLAPMTIMLAAQADMEAVCTQAADSVVAVVSDFEASGSGAGAHRASGLADQGCI